MLIVNGSDDGVIGNQNLITWRFVNYCVHDGGLNIYTHTNIALRLKKEWNYTPTPTLGLRGCYRSNFTCTTVDI